MESRILSAVVGGTQQADGFKPCVSVRRGDKVIFMVICGKKKKVYETLSKAAPRIRKRQMRRRRVILMIAAAASDKHKDKRACCKVTSNG